jgi:hypothetical protein
MINGVIEQFWVWVNVLWRARPRAGRYLVTPRQNPFVLRRALRRDIHRQLRDSGRVAHPRLARHALANAPTLKTRLGLQTSPGPGSNHCPPNRWRS